VWGRPSKWARGALLIALTVLAGCGSDDGTSSQVAECQDKTNPEARFKSLPPGMTAQALDPETQAQIQQLLSKAPDDREFHIRAIVKDGEPVGTAFVIPTTNDADGHKEFLKGFTERAVEHGADGPYEVNVGPATGGTEVRLNTQAGEGVLDIGFVGCHAIGAGTAIGGDAQRIVSAMATAPER
jgi:hypothetical protein